MTEKDEDKRREKKKYTDLELLKFLWSFISPHKKEFSLVTLFLFTFVAFATSAPIFFQQILEIIESSTDTPPNIQLILPGLIAYFILMVAKWFAEVFRNLFRVRLNSKVTMDLRVSVFEKLIDNNMSFFDNNESGVLTSRISNDVQELSETAQRFVELLTSFIRLFVTVGILFSFSPKLTFFSIIFLPVFFIITLSLRKFLRAAEQKWRKNFAHVNQRFSETMRSIAVSKAFAREEENIRTFTDLNEKTYLSSIRRGFAIFIIGPVNDFFRHILLIVILAVGTIESSTNAEFTPAAFYLFIFMLDYYYYPVFALARNFSSFQALFANLDKILEISSDFDKKEVNNGSKDASDIQGEIEFRNVDFSYTPEKQILSDVSFKLKSGERIALVGHTGSGKTTIAALLLRFYEIQKGSIEIDGIPINDYEISSLRKAIGLVSQKVLLFKGTLRDNLLLGNDKATDQEIWNALDAVQAREFIELLPSGLESSISDGGGNLSAGQRQMISFARVLLSNPKVIILDEATSAVDLYTESKIQDATDLLLAGRSSIVIAHRLTTILQSDQIVVLENGLVKQFGTHEELLSEAGLYKEMYQLYFETQSAKYLEKIKTEAHHSLQLKQ